MVLSTMINFRFLKSTWKMEIFSLESGSDMYKPSGGDTDINARHSLWGSSHLRMNGTTTIMVELDEIVATCGSDNNTLGGRQQWIL